MESNMQRRLWNIKPVVGNCQGTQALCWLRSVTFPGLSLLTCNVAQGPGLEGHSVLSQLPKPNLLFWENYISVCGGEASEMEPCLQRIGLRVGIKGPRVVGSLQWNILHHPPVWLFLSIPLM